MPFFFYSLSECYFAGKGAALVLPPNERLRPSSNISGSNVGNSTGGHHSRRVSASGSDIQQHLQSMFYLLRPEETLKMVSSFPLTHVFVRHYIKAVFIARLFYALLL